MSNKHNLPEGFRYQSISKLSQIIFKMEFNVSRAFLRRIFETYLPIIYHNHF